MNNRSNDTIKERIKIQLDNLTSGQKKVADYILKNMEKSSFHTAHELGKEAKVSQTTVIRLSYALGFGGFSEMQSQIQKEWLQQTQSFYTSEELSSTNDPYSKLIEEDIQILREMQNKLVDTDISEIVNELIEADKVMVVGHRSSSAAARWLSFSLSEIRNDVRLATDIVDALEDIINLTDKSVGVFISFPRYSSATFQIAESIKMRGSRIIAITDDFLSPISRIADLKLYTTTNVSSGFNSMASVISLLNIVIFSINMKLTNTIQHRRHQLEELYMKHNAIIKD